MDKEKSGLSWLIRGEKCEDDSFFCKKNCGATGKQTIEYFKIFGVVIKSRVKSFEISGGNPDCKHTWQDHGLI